MSGVKLGRLATAILATLVLSVAVVIGADILRDRQARIRVIKDTPLLAERPDSLAREARVRVVGTLPHGTPVQVLRIRYGKDLMAIRVDSRLGAGWIMYRSDAIIFETGPNATGG